MLSLLISIHFDHPYPLIIDQPSHYDLNPILPLVPLQSILDHH